MNTIGPSPSARRDANFFGVARYLPTEIIVSVRKPAREGSMCDFTEAERQYLTVTRSLTRDEEGREVLVGLTDEESAALMAHRRTFSAGNRLPDQTALSTWLELAEKHADARPYEP